MVYEVIRAADVAFDLELIFDFLVATAEEFGDDTETAFRRSEQRVVGIEARMEKLGNVPHQGTSRPHLGHGVRSVTKDRAVYYIDVDNDRRILRVLAAFFGGQDHEARVLLRLLRS